MMSGARPRTLFSVLIRLMGNVPGISRYLSLTKIAPNCSAALQTDHSGLDGVGIAVRDEQIIASGVGGHNDGFRRGRGFGTT